MAKRTPPSDAPSRKLIAFDADVYTALNRLAQDSMMTIQELADEAFSDLLKKHHRPVLLKDQLKESLRMSPANDRGVRRPSPRSR